MQDAGMDSLSDFCRWAGSQKRAAELLGISETRMSRLANGRTRITPEIADKVERVSGGVFCRARLVFGPSKEGG